MLRESGASSKHRNSSIYRKGLWLLDRPHARTMTVKIILAERRNDGKDPQFARPQMPAAGAAHQEGTEPGAARRYFHRRMHRPAHGDRYSESAQSDRR